MEDSHLQHLNDQQRKAATAPHEPLLIVAGAGTGKTRTLISRIQHLLGSGVPPQHIYAVTFTNKAAREMLERVMNNSRHTALPWIGTFHSLGARILRKEARLLNRTPDFTIYDEQDTLSLARRILKESGLQTSKRSPSLVREMMGKIKGEGLSFEELEDMYPAEAPIAHDLFTAYERALENNNAFDFDDLISKPVHLFKEHPAVLRKYQESIQYLLVDEYQDINLVQYELIRLLVGATGKLSVVGDDQQTIYTWRGSSVETFMRFEHDWPNAQVVLLEENYRSTPIILDAANAVIAHNSNQRPKKLFTQNPSGPLITVAEVRDEDEEGEWIAKRLAMYDYQNHPTAILYRTNAQSRAIESALIGYAIPYHLYGGIQFYDRREIKDILAALRIAANPQDSVSAERLKKTFRKATYLALMDALTQAGSLSPAEIIISFIELSHYREYLATEFTNAEEREENIDELARFAQQFPSLSDFLERAALMQSTDAPSTQRGIKEGSVTLMTMHMAKGLEFDRVHIAGATEGVLPHARSLDTLTELEEERRLFYVGMTRARRELSISFYSIPSRFLFEIPEKYTEFLSKRTSAHQLYEDEERYIDVNW